MAQRGSIKPRKPSILRNFIKSKAKRAPSKRTRKDCCSRSIFSVAPIQQAQDHRDHDGDDPHVGLCDDEPGQCEDMNFNAVGFGGDNSDEEER